MGCKSGVEVRGFSAKIPVESLQAIVGIFELPKPYAVNPYDSTEMDLDLCAEKAPLHLRKDQKSHGVGFRV